MLLLQCEVPKLLRVQKKISLGNASSSDSSPNCNSPILFPASH